MAGFFAADFPAFGSSFFAEGDGNATVLDGFFLAGGAEGFSVTCFADVVDFFVRVFRRLRIFEVLG